MGMVGTRDIVPCRRGFVACVVTASFDPVVPIGEKELEKNLMKYHLPSSSYYAAN